MRTLIRHTVAAFLIGLFACMQTARAEDIEIYTNPAANTLQPPSTVIVLDLNLLGICNSVVTQTSNPNNPDAPQLCLNISNSIILSDLLGGVTSNPVTFLTSLLTGSNLGASGLCAINTALGLTSPSVPVLGVLGVVVGTLTCNTLSPLLAGALNPLVTPLLGGFVTQLISGLVNPLLSTAVGQLPGAVTGLLNTTFSGILNAGQVNLISLLESILSNLVNSNVAIMVSHADRSNATGSPASTCSFADTASLPGARRTTSGCSNGAYFLVGFTPLVNQGAVNSLLTTVTTLLTNMLNPTNLLNSVQALVSTALTTPTQLLPPYQGKEVYAELVHYLAGNDVYNAPLARWDGLTGLLTRDTNVELANGNYKKPPLACRTANVLNVMLTNNIRDTESDATLRSYFPGLPASGAITLGNVVSQAASPGFKDNAGNDINLRSFFLIQNLLTSTATLANTGATVLSYANSLGLLGLGQSFASLLKPVLNVDASLLTPSLTADLTTPSAVRPEAFFGLFKPDVNQKPRWPGNLKKLQVKTDSAGDFQYYDASNALAIGSDGRISTSALTVWTDPSKLGTAAKDGRSSTLGGAGQKIPGYVFGGGGSPGRANGDGKRQLFYDRLAGGVLTLGALDANTAATAAVTELIADTGATAETSACGTAKTVAQVNQELLLYARGFDTGGSCAGSKGATTAVVGRDWMHGALLHSRPVAINYGCSGATCTPDIRVVYGAADGFMRMVRNSDGSESWGFMPRAVMSQQSVLRNNIATPALPFGVDGAPAVLVRDRSPSNGPADGKIEPGNANDRAWLFFGLRRGGRFYYAMNVTNPDAPSLMWRIGPDGLYRSGGFVAGSAGYYSELGLTFSTPQIGSMTVKENGVDTTKPVLIFAAGYNGGRDAASLRLGKDLQRGSDGLVGQNDSVGNAIYVVDAETGDLIWKARQGTFSVGTPFASATKTFQHPLLLDSLPSDVTIVDSDGNGQIDRLYVLDTGGLLWRGDFPGSDRALWTLSPLASLGRHRSATVLNDRRFFHAPDYVPAQGASGRFDAVVFGSGDREDPLNLLTENSLYVYRDSRIASNRTANEVITSDASLKAQADFTDLTTLCASGAANCAAGANLGTGFRIKLAGSGEKALSQPLSSGGVVFFSSYQPPNPATLSCEPSEGSSKLYGIGLSDSRPRFNRFINDSDGDARSQLSATPGLPGEFNPLTATALAANAQTLTLPPLLPYTIYWRERRGDEERAP